jgi:hypothetical protein
MLPLERAATYSRIGSMLSADSVAAANVPNV